MLRHVAFSSSSPSSTMTRGMVPGSLATQLPFHYNHGGTGTTVTMDNDMACSGLVHLISSHLNHGPSKLLQHHAGPSVRILILVAIEYLVHGSARQAFCFLFFFSGRRAEEPMNPPPGHPIEAPAESRSHSPRITLAQNPTEHNPAVQAAKRQAPAASRGLPFHSSSTVLPRLLETSPDMHQMEAPCNTRPRRGSPTGTVSYRPLICPVARHCLIRLCHRLNRYTH
ncbi:hypothetical protein B0T09DRAFT_336952 [Sordaria sp. MPI-SDFR-AT-0083]|nr:hypothetical protein B0T09DRAFT_336952 [Sordaria sp. MPI-SDFR-AT-0083]